MCKYGSGLLHLRVSETLGVKRVESSRKATQTVRQSKTGPTKQEQSGVQGYSVCICTRQPGVRDR